MCTVIRKRYWKHPKTAKEDIPVYKIGDHATYDFSCFKSLYQNFRYVPDVLYETTFDESGDNCVSDSHEDIFRETIPKNQRFYIADGFHSFLSIDRMNKSWINDSRALFIIPKGALYYSNKTENIVSNQIIFKHFI